MKQCEVAFFILAVTTSVIASKQQDAWASISQQIPSCAIPCLNQTQLNSTCLPTDTDCACGVVLDSPVMNGCAAQNCNIGDVLGTINGTATACNMPMRNKGTVLYVTTTVLCSLALVSIILRLLSPSTASQKKWIQVADDWYMMLNFIFIIGMMVCTILIHNNNYGRDIWTLTTREIKNIMILIYNLELYYTLINMLTKLSILGFYLRFFPFVCFPGLRTAIYITIAIVVASGISFTMTIVFQCTPISFLWSSFDEPGPVGSCIDINPYAWTSACFNFAVDLWLMALPLPELIKLSLPRRKKVVVCLMFTVGSFVTTVSVPRILTMSSFKQTRNPTYDLVDVSLWGHVEASVCVILACIPRIGVLFMRLYRKPRSRRTAGSPQSDTSVQQWSDDAFPPLGASKPWGSSSNGGVCEGGKPHLSDG